MLIVNIDLLAAFSALGRSLLKLGSGRVLPPYKKQLKRLPILPVGSNGYGYEDEGVVGVEDFANGLVSCQELRCSTLLDT